MPRRLAQLRKFWRLLPSKTYRRGLLNGVAASLEHQTILSPLQVHTVIDIGANVGQFSLLAQKLYPSAKIFAFEPLQQPAERYEMLFRNQPEVMLRSCAIGPVEQISVMHVSNRPDSSSLLPITTTQERFAPGTAEVALISVEVRRLDNVISMDMLVAPVLLKLDVQGFELEALKGCVGVLPKVAFVYVEVSFVELYAGQALADEIVGFLRAHGFSLAGVNQPSYDREGHCVQADFLFRRRSTT
jgi:FkbM family methyltransferase